MSRNHTLLYLWPFFSFCFDLSGQSGYKPMSYVTDWKVEQNNFGQISQFWFHYRGDTLVHNQTYRMVIHYWSPMYFEEFIFREDTLTQKVYQYLPYLDQEVLYYDFSLQVGDSLYLEHEQFTAHVAHIDTVMSALGPLRRWFFSEGDGGFSYIEMIGGDLLTYQPFFSDPVYTTLQAYHDCDLIYGLAGGELPDSACTASAVNEWHDQGLIFNTLFQDELHITSDIEGINLEIFNVQGTRMLAADNMQRGVQHFYSGGWTPGIYFLRFTKHNQVCTYTVCKM